MSDKFFLPSKLNSYLRRLDLEYERSGKALLREIIKGAKVTTVEETGYDNWNGGTYSHDAVFYLPVETMKKIAFDEQEKIAEELAVDLNRCAANIDNENFRIATLELVDDSDPTCQRATYLNSQPPTDPSTISFWEPGQLRLFISHRDSQKIAARALADALKTYGVSAFVAHDTIEPMSRWQHQIEAGLATMEVMLAFITDDFHDSTWTNQEVGFAIGKNVPIIALKYGTRDPSGFIADKQALRAHFDRTDDAAAAVYKLLVDKLGQKDRLQETLIAAFLAAPHWGEARDRFDRMSTVITSLTDKELARIQKGFAANDQLYTSIYLDNQYHRLAKFLEKCTGKRIEINDRIISIARELNDDIPF